MRGMWRISSTFLMITFHHIIDFDIGSANSRSSGKENMHLSGKNQYENLLIKSEMPNFGECWKASLEQTKYGCKHLTNTLTHQLAYAFTRCFYIELGKEIPECSVEPETCKDNLDPSILHGTYAMFFMHTRDMCFFLENQDWQEKTEETVLKLSETSKMVIDQLEDADRVQQKIASGQEETLTRQQSILEGSNTVAAKVSSLQTGVVDMFGQFQKTYDIQMLAVAHIFDKIAVLEKIFLMEYTGTQAFLLWLGSLIVSYILSSTPRTYGARFPMFLLTLVFSVLEITVINGAVSRTLCHMLQDMQMMASDDITICVYHCVKTWRWTFFVCNAFTLLYFAATFENYDTKIYRTLVELQKDIKGLKGNYSSPALSKGKGIAIALGSGDNQSDLEGVSTISRMNLVTTDQSNDLDQSVSSGGSSDADSSGSDCESDYSYKAPSESSTHVSDISDISELSTSELLGISCELKKDDSSLRQSVLKRNAIIHDSPTISRYNLRPRNRTSTPNKVLIEETERQFTRIVKDLAKNRGRLSHRPAVL